MSYKTDLCKCGIAKTDCEYHDEIEDYSYIKNEFNKKTLSSSRTYFDKNGEHHRLIGAATEYY